MEDGGVRITARATLGREFPTCTLSVVQRIHGVDVMKSSTKFTFTHEKAMVVDDNWAFVIAMNMGSADDVSKKRDFGVIT